MDPISPSTSPRHIYSDQQYVARDPALACIVPPSPLHSTRRKRKSPDRSLSAPGNNVPYSDILANSADSDGTPELTRTAPLCNQWRCTDEELGESVSRDDRYDQVYHEVEAEQVSSDRVDEYCYLCTLSDENQSAYSRKIVELWTRLFTQVPTNKLCRDIANYYDMEIRPWVEGTPEWGMRTVYMHFTKHRMDPHTLHAINVREVTRMIHEIFNQSRVLDPNGNPVTLPEDIVKRLGGLIAIQGRELTLLSK